MFSISLFGYVGISEVAFRPSEENDEKRKRRATLGCPPG
jgi:hypothetical protein